MVHPQVLGARLPACRPCSCLNYDMDEDLVGGGTVPMTLAQRDRFCENTLLKTNLPKSS
ncbi:MAG: hypothetical protein V7L20_18300 [Nostoc sp.]|uniref:hypothetical protein n=1 Tax=Nostoc sp. TaxID=1180 RepID=UPI002FF721EC